MAGQAPRRVALHPIAEQRDPDTLAAHGVVAMGYGVDQRLTHSAVWELGPVLPLQPDHTAAAAHVLGKPDLGPPHRLDQRIAHILAQELIAHLAAAVAHQRDLALRETPLDCRALAEEEQTGVRRTIDDRR